MKALIGLAYNIGDSIRIHGNKFRITRLSDNAMVRSAEKVLLCREFDIRIGST